MKKILVSNIETHNSKRLDYYLSNEKGQTRSSIQKLIKSGLVYIDNKKTTKSSQILSNGNTILIENKKIYKENFPDLKYIFKDDFLLIIDKPSGQTVHSGIKTQHNTLAHQLQNIFPKLINVGDKGRNGIVHRLDKETSGLLIVALKNSSYIKMNEIFKNRKIEKNYIALLHGHLMQPQGSIIAPIGRNPKNRTKQILINTGRKAITEYKLIKKYKNCSLVDINLKTGRTHQIRVHFNSIGHPIVGDKKYGKSNYKHDQLNRHFLHAYKIKFKHPINQEDLIFSSDLPNDLSRYLDNLNA